MAADVRELAGLLGHRRIAVIGYGLGKSKDHRDDLPQIMCLTAVRTAVALGCGGRS